MIPKVQRMGGGMATIRFAGWDFIHTIRLRVENGDSYVDIFGIQIGPASFYWTNPWSG